MTDLFSELEQLARAATPGPWTVCLGSGINVMTGIVAGDDGPVIADCFPDWSIVATDTGYDHRPTMNYIAALSPERVLALVACVRAAEKLRSATELLLAYGRFPESYEKGIAARDAFDAALSVLQHKERL